jgi:hypothetical protein
MAHDYRFGHPIQVYLTIVGMREATYPTVDTKMPLFTASGHIPDCYISTGKMDFQLEETTLGKPVGLSIDTAYTWSHMTHYTVHRMLTPIGDLYRIYTYYYRIIILGKFIPIMTSINVNLHQLGTVIFRNHMYIRYTKCLKLC